MPVLNQQELTRANGKNSANASVTAIAAPGAGLRIKVFMLKINVKTADDVGVLSGSTEMDMLYLGATSGVVYDFGDHPLVLEVNEALVLTKQASTAMSYVVHYLVE